MAKTGRRTELRSLLKEPAKLKTKFPLKEILYYRIGGSAEALLLSPGPEDLQTALRWVSDEGLPFHVFGSGTNLLVSDEGLEGLSIYLGPDEKFQQPTILSDDDEHCVFRVPSAAAKADVLRWSLNQKLLGLEFSAGIPGTMGGAVYMNAGTKWGSYGDVIREVQFYSIVEGLITRRAEEMGFKYRGLGEGILEKGTVVLDVTLRLKKCKDDSEAAKSRSLVDEILLYRGTRQPLDYPSCGSVFKNPENSAKGAGRLIEASGLKGLRRGNAMVSTKHANFILNLGNAKASDVKALIDEIIRKVRSDHSIELHPEVVLLGDAF